jgi:hypothetical protein
MAITRLRWMAAGVALIAGLVIDWLAMARDWLHAGFDPRAVARAELAWWVARRTPGQDSPERIGRLMAEAYARL